MSKSSEPISSPHDRFFQGAMSHPPIALEFIQKYVPKNIVAKMDPGSLKMTEGTFIDPSLKKLMTDIIYEAQFSGKEGYFYFLIEHQSTPDPEMPLRLLEYTLQIIRNHRKKYPNEKYPLIYPCVIYNGKRPYNYTTDIFELFEEVEMARSIFLQPFQLIDLNKVSDDDLQTPSYTSMLEMLLKHAHTRDVFHFLKKLVPHIEFLEGQDTIGFLKLSLYYLLETHERQEVILPYLEKALTPQQHTKIMTAAQELRLEGRLKGLQEGRQEESRLILDKLIRRRFPTTVTAKHLHLIAHAEMESLKVWLDRIIDAENVEAVFSA